MTALDNLSATQRANAAQIVAETQREGLPLAAAQIAVTVAIVESGLMNQANSNVPESLSVPYEKVGSDHTSLGLFQQQNSWGTVVQRMTPASSTALFLARLKNVSGWQAQDPGKVAQTIQVSAYPDRYDQQYSQGAAIASALWSGDSSPTDFELNTGTAATAPVWKNSAGQPIAAPPAGTYTTTTDSQGNAEYVPTVTAGSLTDEQGTQLVAWLQTYAPSLNDWSKFVPPFTTKVPGAAPGFDTYGAVLVNTYAQALQGNGLDAGGAVPGLDLPNPLAGLEKIFSWLTTKNNWIRIGLGVLGAIIILLVAVTWFRGTSVGASIPIPVPL